MNTFPAPNWDVIADALSRALSVQHDADVEVKFIKKDDEKQKNKGA